MCFWEIRVLGMVIFVPWSSKTISMKKSNVFFFGSHHPDCGQPKGETFNVVVDTVWGLTTEEYFNMPDRSLTVLDAPSENQAYLNIPAQLVYRDSATRQFTFTGFFYSDKAAYGNN